MSEETQGTPPPQNPPPSGPPQGQPTPPGTPDPYNLGPTSCGMAANVAAGLACIFGWLGGLIFFLIEKQNKFVRFYAMQSILVNICFFVLYMIFTVLFVGAAVTGGAAGAAGAAAGLGIGSLLIMLVWLAFFIVWIITVIMAFTGKTFKIPVLGDLATKWS